jgi:phospho-N-acetylmuramoyl-pentapeptide-transferase
MIHRLLVSMGIALPAALRAVLACATAAGVCLLCGPFVIAWLRRLKVGEKTEKTPIENAAMRARIAGKSGTPTMGGILLLGSLAAAVALWGDIANGALLAALACSLALGALGAADDLAKLRARSRTSRGLKVRHKLAVQGLIGAVLGLYLLRHTALTGTPAGLHHVSGMRLLAATTALAVIWAALVVATMSNATNVTDGLDGLLAGLTPMAAVVLAVGCVLAGRPGGDGAWVAGADELAVYCGALGGAALGFLWFNRHPARVFMGDTGSLAIGGGLAATALAARQEALLAFIGLVFLAEFGSSLLQIACFRLLRRRVLPVAPIHHIFEMQGAAEPRIVRGFYLFGAAAGAVGLGLVWF